MPTFSKIGPLVRDKKNVLRFLFFSFFIYSMAAILVGHVAACASLADHLITGFLLSQGKVALVKLSIHIDFCCILEVSGGYIFKHILGVMTCLCWVKKSHTVEAMSST